MDDQTNIFPPFRYVAQFADGSRLLFDGLTQQQAYDAIMEACAQHGDCAWYDGVTDQHYEKGQYYKLLPPPPSLPFPVFDVTDAEDPQKALQDPLEADGAPERE